MPTGPAIRYDAALARERWDAIVIGSGIGGLTCAALLARAGQRVLVLERHYEPGGFLHTFKRKGFEWDVGVHYIGRVDRPRSVERRIFDHLSEGRLGWAPMGGIYDRAIIDGESYDFVPGVERQIESFAARFPGQEQALRAYYAQVADCARSGGRYFMERALPSPVAAVAGPLLRRRFQRYADRTAYEVLRGLTDDRRLIEVLCTQCGDYGMPPNQVSFAMHAMVVHHYLEGGCYPVGGAARIHESIAQTIVSRGGIVAVKAEAAAIVLEGKRAAGVRLDNGDAIRASHVISDAGVHNTFLKLLPADYPWPFDLRGDLARVKRSMAHICLYVGLDGSDAELGLPRYNYWIYDTPLGDGTPGGRITDAYLSFASAKDPAWPERHPGKAAVQCIGFAPYGDYARWADSRWRKRGNDYETMKAAFRDAMLARLHALHPATRGRVVWAEVSTPLSTRHFANYDEGQIYGLEHSPARFRLRWLRPRTPIAGLWLTGQDAASAGVTGAMMGGVLTASAMTGRNLMAAALKTGAG